MHCETHRPERSAKISQPPVCARVRASARARARAYVCAFVVCFVLRVARCTRGRAGGWVGLSVCVCWFS